MSEMFITIVNALFALVGLVSVIASLLVWRGCMKMYTEFFKNEAMKGRTKP
jgi:uncharacterized membrane protein